MRETEVPVDVPPRPRADLVIQVFEEGLQSSAPTGRYLIDCGQRQFVASAAVYALIRALCERPADWNALARRYRQLSGENENVADLRRIVAGQLPRELFDADGSQRRSPFLLQAELFSGELLSPLTARLARLFTRWVALPTLILFFAVQTMVLPEAMSRVHIEWSAFESLLLILGLLATVGFHELGHLSACARAGCRHGGLGVGLYFVFPAMYSEVSKAWTLPPRSRLLIDTGGIYFQSMTVIGIGAWALVSGSDFAHKLVWLVTFAMLHTLNPFFKFDGYWMLSDATGLTNLHAQLRATLVDLLRGLVPGARRGPATRPAWQSATLYVYTLLCTLYFAFVIHFLTTAMRATLRSYPQIAADTTAAIAAALQRHEFSAAAAALLKLLLESAWPACLLLFCLLIGWTFGKRAVGIVKDVLGNGERRMSGDTGQ